MFKTISWTVSTSQKWKFVVFLERSSNERAIRKRTCFIYARRAPSYKERDDLYHKHLLHYTHKPNGTEKMGFLIDMLTISKLVTWFIWHDLKLNETSATQRSTYTSDIFIKLFGQQNNTLFTSQKWTTSLPFLFYMAYYSQLQRISFLFQPLQRHSESYGPLLQLFHYLLMGWRRGIATAHSYNTKWHVFWCNLVQISMEQNIVRRLWVRR